MNIQIFAVSSFCFGNVGFFLISFPFHVVLERMINGEHNRLKLFLFMCIIDIFHLLKHNPYFFGTTLGVLKNILRKTCTCSSFEKD